MNYAKKITALVRKPNASLEMERRESPPGQDGAACVLAGLRPARAGESLEKAVAP
jgi:hypothetical protein